MASAALPFLTSKSARPAAAGSSRAVGVRNLSTPGSSRGGMAFWMDIPTLEMGQMQLRPFTGATISASRGRHSRADTAETRVRSRQSRAETMRSVMLSAGSTQGGERMSRASTSGSVSKQSSSQSRGFTAESAASRRLSTATSSRAVTANALDFLERPPSEMVSGTNLPLLSSNKPEV